MGLKQSRNLLKVIFDPGSTETLISRKALPKGIKPLPLADTKDMTTLAGTMQTKEMMHLRGLELPKFDKNNDRCAKGFHL